MLVLTRRAGESIVIGNDVVITVLEIRGGQIRIGVDAPRNLAVHRAEIYQQVMAENQAAVASADRHAALLQTRASRLRLEPPGAQRGGTGDPSAR
jgi:carbon storage regulator